MENLAGKIKYAQFLSDGSEVLYKEDVEKGTVNFTLPAVAPYGLSPNLCCGDDGCGHRCNRYSGAIL